jgi:integrase
VCIYLGELSKSAKSYAVVKMASAAISTMHEMSGFASPTKHALCKDVRAAAKRALGLLIKNRKEPLDLDVCLAIVTMLAYQGAPVWSLMLASYIMLCFAAFLRYDDAVNIQVEHVKFYELHAEVFLAKRKNDQFRSGNVVCVARGKSDACPVKLLHRYVAQARLAKGSPLFQGFDGHKARFEPLKCCLSGKRITYGQARDQVLKYVGKALAMPAEHVRARFGLHSLRSGGASLVAAHGVDERKFQAHGGWQSRSAMLVYLQESLDNKLGVTAAMGY